MCLNFPFQLFSAIELGYVARRDLATERVHSLFSVVILGGNHSSLLLQISSCTEGKDFLSTLYSLLVPTIPDESADEPMLDLKENGLVSPPGRQIEGSGTRTTSNSVPQSIVDVGPSGRRQATMARRRGRPRLGSMDSRKRSKR